MKHLSLLSRFTLLFTLTACALEDPVATLVHEDGPRPPREESGLALTAHALVSSDAAGRLVVTRAEGAVPWGSAPLDGPLVDLAPSPGGVVVATSHEESTAFAHFSVAQASLGPADPRGWLDGDVRVQALPAGLLGFEEAHGPRWRLWGDAASTPSRACGRPSSLVVLPQGDHDEVVALVHDHLRPPRVARARVDASGVGPCVELPLALPWIHHAPRLVRVGTSALVIDAHAGGVELGWLAEGGSLGAFSHLPIVAGAASDAIGVEVEGDAGVHHVALLLGEPARLAVFAILEDDSSPPEVADVVGMTLPGAPRPPERFLFRSLAAVGARVFAATSEGVFAVDVRHGDVGLEVHTDGTGPLEPNALRAPIAVVRAP